MCRTLPDGSQQVSDGLKGRVGHLRRASSVPIDQKVMTSSNFQRGEGGRAVVTLSPWNRN